MSKKKVNFTDKFIVLCPPDTRDHLVAISYYRGEAGSYAGPARDFIARGIREFIESLSAEDKKRFDEILSNVRITHNSVD